MRLRREMRLSRGVVACLVVAAAAAPALASNANWREVGRSQLPLYYYQGTTHDEAGNHYFTGVWSGLYRTDPQLRETGRNDDVIPSDVRQREGYNHVGDPSYLAGKVYLPLECYYPPIGNTCKTGAIGIADAATLQFRYYVKLDPSEIQKAMWCEVSPDGALLWTQSGRDLLAYDMAALTEANAAPAALPIKAVRRLDGVVPEGGATGATFIGGRLFVARETDNGGEIWSIDLEKGASRVEVEVDFVGESEGLDDDFDLKRDADGLPGSLHYMVAPYNEEGYPTSGPSNVSLFHFERGGPPDPPR